LKTLADAGLGTDFGMTVAKKTEDKKWFRGYGVDQYVYYAQQGPKKFLGGCFEVESHAELEKYVCSHEVCFCSA
jgi:hypothetical protein